MTKILDRTLVDALSLRMSGFGPMSMQEFINQTNEKNENDLQRELLIRNGERWRKEFEARKAKV